MNKLYVEMKEKNRRKVAELVSELKMSLKEKKTYFLMKIIIKKVFRNQLKKMKRNHKTKTKNELIQKLRRRSIKTYIR